MGGTILTETYAGTSVLTGAVKDAIGNGMLDMKATVFEVVQLSVPVVIAVAGLTVGVKYAIKQVKGIISAAA